MPILPENTYIAPYKYELATTRYEAGKTDPPSVAEPYVSLWKELFIQARLFKRAETIRTHARHPLYLIAGQSVPPNGALGRSAAPPVPEILGGTFYSRSV